MAPIPQLGRQDAILLFEALAVITTTSSISSSPPCSSAWVLPLSFAEPTGVRVVVGLEPNLGLSLSQVP